MLTIVRPSPIVVSRKRREIAKRYAAKRRRFGPVSFAAIRVSELSRLFAHRYSGLQLPDSDEGVQMARVMAHHMGRLRDAPRRISQWCERNAPWLGLQEIERLIRDATECPLRWKADRLAWLLGVTAAERDEVGLRTIGATDQTREQRAEIRKAKACIRAKAWRVARKTKAAAE